MGIVDDVLAAAASADPAVPVAVKGFTWGAAGSWATFLAVIGAIGAFLRGGGVDAFKEWNRSRKERRDEDRDEELTDKKQLAELQTRMTRMQGAFAFLANAVTVSVNGLSSDDPRTRTEAAAQTRELVAMAVSTLGNEDPYVKALDRVASVPPVNRNPAP